MIGEIILEAIKIFSFLSLLFIVFLFAVIIFFRKKDFGRKFLWIMNRNYLAFGLLITISSIVGSLYLSEFMGFEPCALCIWQRIFIYPQAVLFGVALYFKDKKIARYVLPLSVIGGIIAFYQYMTQFGLAGEGVCDALGSSVSCSQIYISAFGFITIPLMSTIAFTLLSILSIIVLIKK